MEYARPKTTEISIEATASGTAAMELKPYTKFIRAQLDVTAIGADLGTPTLDVTIESTLDDINWDTVGTFAQVDEVAREVICIHPGNTAAGFSPLVGPRIRCKYVIAGGATEPDVAFYLRWFCLL